MDIHEQVKNFLDQVGRSGMPETFTEDIMQNTDSPRYGIRLFVARDEEREEHWDALLYTNHKGYLLVLAKWFMELFPQERIEVWCLHGDHSNPCAHLIAAPYKIPTNGERSEK